MGSTSGGFLFFFAADVVAPFVHNLCTFGFFCYLYIVCFLSIKKKIGMGSTYIQMHAGHLVNRNYLKDLIWYATNANTFTLICFSLFSDLLIHCNEQIRNKFVQTAVRHE